MNPGVTEVVGNGIDDDCNPATSDSELAYDDDGDGVTENEGDCDDANADVHPGAVEVCNGIDDNCDGSIDEGCQTYYEDGDGDGYGNASVSMVDTSQPSGYVLDSSDCDDTNGAVNPGVTEVVGNGIDDDCNPATSDSELAYDDDGDGVTENEGDCDDANAMCIRELWRCATHRRQLRWQH